MLGQDSLEQAVRAAGIEVPPLFLPEAGSTNTEAIALAEEGAPEWTIVSAGHQTAGRGRMGRRWASAPGKSLLFSMILRPTVTPEAASVISLLVAAEMAAACRRVAGVEIATKWPNDLVAANRKVGGILAEAHVAAGSLEHVVIGVGLNVSTRREEFPEQLHRTATSLSLQGGVVEPEALLAEFLRSFREAYRPVEEGFGRSVVERYRPLCATLGKRVRATAIDGSTVEGRATDVDERGGLVLETPDGTTTVGFGEIAHLE